MRCIRPTPVDVERLSLNQSGPGATETPDRAAEYIGMRPPLSHVGLEFWPAYLAATAAHILSSISAGETSST